MIDLEGEPMETDIKQNLLALSEPEYREFARRLLPGVPGVLGVRLPKLRRLARRLAKENWQEACRNASADTFEEIMLHGMVIGYAQAEPAELFPAIEAFLPRIGNWSVCDSFCSGLHAAKQCPAEFWEFINPLFFHSQEFTVRFAVVMSLHYFLDEPHLPALFALLERVNHPGYYVKMAVAWAVSLCYVYFPGEAMAFLLRRTLDDATYQKALQKIVESRCVPAEEKEKIRALRNDARARRIS